MLFSAQSQWSTAEEKVCSVILCSRTLSEPSCPVTTGRLVTPDRLTVTQYSARNCLPRITGRPVTPDRRQFCLPCSATIFVSYGHFVTRPCLPSASIWRFSSVCQS
ncbi:hypothetical protein Dimus_014622 [Dionaea muscipula]